MNFEAEVYMEMPFRHKMVSIYVKLVFLVLKLRSIRHFLRSASKKYATTALPNKQALDLTFQLGILNDLKDSTSVTFTRH